MSRVVTLTLTKAEARALFHAASEALEFADVAEAAFPNASMRRTAFRAHDKLRAVAFAPKRRKDVR